MFGFYKHIQAGTRVSIQMNLVVKNSSKVRRSGAVFLMAKKSELSDILILVGDSPYQDLKAESHRVFFTVFICCPLLPKGEKNIQFFETVSFSLLYEHRISSSNSIYTLHYYSCFLSAQFQLCVLNCIVWYYVPLI